MLNRAIMMGRLCADPELKKTQSGVSVCSFRIAVDRDYGKKEEKETDFFDVVAWRATAEFICKFFSKGRMIVAEGRMQTRPWTDKDGNKRVTTELVVDNAYFGDSKRDADGGQPVGGGYPTQEPGGYGAYSDYNGPVPGSVPGDYAPDF